MLAISLQPSTLDNAHAKQNASHINNPETEQVVRLEIKASTLSALFANNHICAADFHCMDHSSKSIVKKCALRIVYLIKKMAAVFTYKHRATLLLLRPNPVACR